MRADNPWTEAAKWGCKKSLACDTGSKAVGGLKDKAGDAAGGALSSAFGKAMKELAEMLMEAVGKLAGGLGSIWVHVPTPDLTKDGPNNGASPGEAGGSEAQMIVETLLGWVAWVGFGIAVMALMAVGVKIAVDHRRGSETMNLGRLGAVLLAVMLISGSSALAKSLISQEPSDSGGTVGFIQDSLWFYTAAAVVLSVIISGVKMAWEQRAEPGKELVTAWFRFVLISAGGVTALNMMLAAGDAFSVWILDSSLDCDLSGDKNCFGRNITAMLGLASMNGIGIILVIIFAVMAAAASIIQIGLMLMRNGLLVVLAGILPLSASMTNTDIGRSMFKKSTTWLLALVLYKPTAAIIYATAFRLSGSDVFGGKDDILRVLSGLMLMIVALVALPALQKFITGAVSATASGNAAGAGAMAAGAAIPTGAIAAGKLMGGGGSGGGGGDEGGGSGGPSGAPTGGPPSAGGGGEAAAGGGQAAGAGAAGAGAAGAATAGVGTAAVVGAEAVQKGMDAVKDVGAAGADATGADNTGADKKDEGDSNGS